METEGVTVSFSEDGIAALARIAAEVNPRSRISARGGFTP
jgi:ATP-dependent protease HslVU (ClpYQ) ATPase subunit